MSLRAAVIGLGVGEQHAIAYREHPGSELVGLADVDDEQLASVSARFPGCRATTEPEALLRDPGIDIVSICSYDSAHADQIVTALVHGKHVFVEKPLCLFPEEAARVKAALRAHPEQRLCSNLILRRSPRFVDLKRRVQAGELGTVYHIDAAYNYGRLQKITAGWRGQEPYYSVMLGGGIHLIDLVLWLLEERPVEVYAVGNAICSRGTAFKFNDFETATLRFASGCVVQVGANFGCVYPHFHKLEVYGTEATFVNDLPAARLYRDRAPEQPPMALATEYPGCRKGDLLSLFLNDLTGIGPKSMPGDLDDSFDSLAICFAVSESIRSGKPHAITYR